MEIVNSFVPLLQVFAFSMTEPTFRTFETLAAGWLFAPRRTVMGMVRASGSERHHAAFHRVFTAARWSIDRVGLALFDWILQRVPQETVFLAGDDTLLARFGLKVFGAGMHRDAVLSSRGHTVTRWGHCWVVLCVVIESSRRPGRMFALPILARLYLNKDAAAKWRRKYRSKTDLMIDMLQRLQQHAPRQKLHFVGDSAYTAPAVLARIPKQIAVTGRVGTRARLHAPPPKPKTPKRGRPRVRGERLPNPEEMLNAKGLRRLTLKLYSRSTYKMRVAEMTARFYRTPDREVHVVAVEHLRGGRGREVFYSTESNASAEQILRWFSWRWPIEVTFHDAKGHMGVDQPQSRKAKAVERTAPTGLLLYSMVILWHEFIRKQPARAMRPSSDRRGASLSDMLAALRRDCLDQTKQKHLSTPEVLTAVQKILKPLEYLLALAT